MQHSARDERDLLLLIAHELRSPASVVAGYLRLLLKEDNTSDRARQMTEAADRSCARVLALVRELGELASLSNGNGAVATGVPLFSLCAEIVADSAAGSETASIFCCAPEDRDTLVPGEALKLKQVLVSLMYATQRERGTRPLGVYGFVSREPAVPEAVVAFGDPGGMEAAEVLSRREHPFDRWRGGIGLSMPIAFRIVESSGGQLWSLSPLSRAACALSLPVWQGPVQ
jgi:signal transduction histidine kinase